MGLKKLVLISAVEAADQALKLWSDKEMIKFIDYSKTRMMGVIGNVQFLSNVEYARLMVVVASNVLADMIKLVESSGLFRPGKFVMTLESANVCSV